jgi:hypothetical protein
MNFDFSDDQKLLKDQARKFLSDKCTRKVVRTVLDNTDSQTQLSEYTCHLKIFSLDLLVAFDHLKNQNSLE